MGVLAWIVVGVIAGWLADWITGRDHRLVTNLIVGVVGAMIGGFVFASVLGFRYDQGVNLATIVVATVGAVICLALFSRTASRRTWR